MISEKPWKADSVLLLASLLMLCLTFGSLAGMYLPKYVPALANVDASFFRFVVSTLSFQGSALVLISLFLRLHGVRWRDLLLGRAVWLPRIVFLGVGASILVLPAALTLNWFSYQLMTLFNLPPEKQAAVVIVEKTVGVGKQVCFAVAAIALAPFVEEVLFRGILYPFLKPRLKMPLAVAFTSILFAAIHANLLTFVPLVFLALVLTALYEKTDALLTPILAHAFFNATNFFMLLYQDRLVRYLEHLRERI
jgi:membrane protease YdiL (CAAX protease family)